MLKPYSRLNISLFPSFHPYSHFKRKRIVVDSHPHFCLIASRTISEIRCILLLFLVFLPAEALRLSKRFEFHYTPKCGSWLDIAEIELAALTKQCLGKRRIDNLEDLNNELQKWHTDRNTRQKGVNWQFTTDDARIKLKYLYPLVTF